ncbi:MAG: hypothetical protein JST76_00180 [Bacteroidetes bacterium]|nr:hypothetical protein [Bacteroidota bacterium]
MKKLKFELLTTLQDGTAVSLDDFSVGGVISIIDADGNKSVAPDGEYTFEDGSTATVTDGAISAITPATEDKPEEMATDAPASGSTSGTTEDTAADAEDATADEDLAGQMQTLTDAVNSMIGKLESFFEFKKAYESDKKAIEEKFNALSAKSILDKTPNIKVALSHAERAMENIRAFNEAKKK